MHKPSANTHPVSTHAGADVSARWIDAAAQRNGHDQPETARFDNDAAGHQALCRWLTQGRRTAQIVLEASGLYSLDLALALDQHERITVMVANPRLIKDYARARGRRSKTDRIDAALLCDFAQRMPFSAWTPPDAALLELRQLARRITQLVAEHTRESARLHAASASATSSRFLLNDLEVNRRHLHRRIERVLAQALRVIEQHPDLRRAYRHLVSVRGIAARSAIQILAEVLVLPAGLSARQWVAQAGLDVVHHRSGTSVDQAPHISRRGSVHLRRALFMPALVAVRHEPSVRAFYSKLIAQGKKPMVALVAVMRKLLHAIYGMLKHDADFDGAKFYRAAPATA